ncbi:hypothetical protein AVEN_17643-2-1, partial [Araneus ventricosus]
VFVRDLLFIMDLVISAATATLRKGLSTYGTFIRLSSRVSAEMCGQINFPS